MANWLTCLDSIRAAMKKNDMYDLKCCEKEIERTLFIISCSGTKRPKGDGPPYLTVLEKGPEPAFPEFNDFRMSVIEKMCSYSEIVFAKMQGRAI